MTYSRLEIRCKQFFFKYDLVGGETMSFGEKCGRQGFATIYPYSHSNAASNNEVDLYIKQSPVHHIFQVISMQLFSLFV